MRLLFAMLAASYLAACGNPDVTITYHENGPCNGFVWSNNPDWETNVGPGQAYVIFAISDIQNPSGSGANFNFDPNKLHIGTDFVSTSDPIFANVFGPFGATTYHVNQGADLSFSVSAEAALVVQDGFAAAQKADYVLQYQTSSGDPGVVLAKVPDGPASGNQNCRSVALQ
jgi:hypothetical protein